MKRLFCFCALLFLSSCANNIIPLEDDYFVKYEAFIETWGPQRVIEATYIITTDKGNQQVTTTNNKWSETYGPVKKGFVAYFSGKAQVQFSDDIPMTLSIYVCRKDEPFTKKAQIASNGRTGVVTASVSYTIDY